MSVKCLKVIEKKAGRRLKISVNASEREVIMKREKKKKRFQKLKLLNPKNLAAEVHVYGYNFSWKAHMLVVLYKMSR